MNLESNICGFHPVTKDQQRKRVFQRRLHDRLSESRMLELLDQELQRTGHFPGSSNQEHEEQHIDQQDEKDEEELVCVSTMVRLANRDSVSPESLGFQAGGVLETVRYIHRQRAVGSGNQENQAGH